MAFLPVPLGQMPRATFLTGARVDWQLDSAWPLVHEVPSSIPGDIASLLLLLSFLCSFDYNVVLDTLKAGGGVKWVQCRPQIYQLFLSRVIEVKYCCFTILPFLLSHLVRMQCSSGGTRSVSLYSGHSFVVSLSRERWNYLKAPSTRIRIFLKPFFSPFNSYAVHTLSTRKRSFRGPKAQVL